MRERPPLPEHSDPFIVHSVDRIDYANDAALALLERRSRDAVVGEPIARFVAEADRDPLTTQFERISSQQAPTLGMAVGLDARGGRHRDIIVASAPFQWQGDEKIRSSLIDISGTLSASPILKQTMDAAPVGITIADARSEDEPLIYVNDEFLDITGYDRSEAIGRNCRFLQGQQTREEPVAEMRAAIEANEPVTVSLRNYRIDGSMFWNRVTITPVTDDTGAVTHYFGFQEDITEEKRYEWEKNVFEEHAEAARHAMFITNRAGVIEYVNPAFERITGYTASEAIGRTPRILKSDQHDAVFYEELWETITAGEIWESEVTNRTKLGELFRVRQTIVPIVNDSGKITHFTAIEQDISETEFTEQVLDVMNRMLRHNLRTSVNVIDGYGDMLVDSVDDPQLRAAAKKISERTSTLKKMSEQTTAIRDLVQNQADSHTTDVSVIAETVRNCRDAYDADIDLQWEVEEGVVIANASVLQLAIEEAIENAVVHNDRDRPSVEITVSHSREPSELWIEIADDGPGIPESEWDVITTGQETPLYHSSGIGLWLVYWAVTALSGTVELGGNDPRGSILTYQLPLVPDQP